MCMGCMGHADFLATGGVLGVASLRVGARMLLGSSGRSPRRVSDAEVDEFVASLQGPPAAAGSVEHVPAGAPATVDDAQDAPCTAAASPRTTASVG